LHGPGAGRRVLFETWMDHLEADLLRPVYDSLIEHGLFVPRQLDYANFEQLYNALSPSKDLLIPNPLDNGNTISCSRQDVFASSYMFVPETRMFYRVKSDADGYV